jgi:hypothetical protein
MFVWIDAYVTERGPTTMTDPEAQSIASESVQSECGTHVRVCSAQCCVSQWLGLFGRALALKDSFLIITWIYNKHFHYFLPNAITHSPIRHITFVRHCLLWHCLVWHCLVWHCLVLHTPVWKSLHLSPSSLALLVWNFRLLFLGVGI